MIFVNALIYLYTTFCNNFVNFISKSIIYTSLSYKLFIVYLRISETLYTTLSIVSSVLYCYLFELNIPFTQTLTRLFNDYFSIVQSIL